MWRLYCNCFGSICICKRLAFGDFVGGLLNPFFAFANLILLVTISYQLRAREEAQAEADREEQRKRAQFEIAFGLKHEAIKELTRILNDLPAPFEFIYASYTPYVSQAATDFSKFCDNHSHLFPTHQEAFNAMKNSIERLSTVSRPYDATLNVPNDAELRLRLYRDLVSCYTEDFGFIRPAFIHSVKSSMRDY